MAVRYVKDFEFPAASGYTKSATKVTGQMYAKGGEVKESAPKGKGMMIVIGVGTPKKPPMKKAQGSYVDQDEYMRQLEERSPIQSGTYGKKKAAPAPKKKEAPRDVEASDLYDAEQLKRMERGYAKGGMTKAQKKIGKVMSEYKAGELHSGKDGPVVKNRKQAIAIALSEAVKSKMKKAKGGSVKHPDEAMDKALIKKMVKPEARKMMDGGAAKHPDEAMDKALIRKMVKPEARAMKSGGGVKSPLQSMKISPMTPSMERAKSVPVASRAPMIQSPSMEAPAPAAAKMGVGIGESRPGKPNVGRIRAMMAKAASAARPENAPAVMKRGGMTKGKC